MIDSLKSGVLKLPMGMFLWQFFFKVLPIVLFISWFSSVLIPFFIAIVLAYIFVSLDRDLVHRGLPSSISMPVVAVLVVGIFGGVSVYLAPIVWEQSINFTREIPALYASFKAGLTSMIETYLGAESKDVISNVFAHINDVVAKAAGSLANHTVGSIVNLSLVALYLVIIPLLTFLFIKDRQVILTFASRFVTSQSTRLTIQDYWNKIDVQLANYIQGKLIEIVIIGAVSFVLFMVLGLKYAALLATCVGLSVLIPYIGAFTVSLPIAAVALAQWGIDTQTFVLFFAYLLLQVFDGNVLVPFIFSEKMKLHPIAILFAVFLFGYIGGIIGVFFSIPLLALMKVYIDRNFPVENVAP